MAKENHVRLTKDQLRRLAELEERTRRLADKVRRAREEGWEGGLDALEAEAALFRLLGAFHRLKTR